VKWPALHKNTGIIDVLPDEAGCDLQPTLVVRPTESPDVAGMIYM
jgi:hypothetical protein